MAKEQLVQHRSREDSTQHGTTAEEADRLAAVDAVKQKEAAKTAGRIAVEATGDLLDEIDSVLESNAHEFVRAYVQKGGE